MVVETTCNEYNLPFTSQFKWPQLTACPPGCIQLQGKFTHKPETCSNYNRTEPIPIISNSFRVKRHLFTISLSDTQECIRDNQKPSMAWSTVRLKRWREVAGLESYSRWTASQSYVLKKKNPTKICHGIWVMHLALQLIYCLQKLHIHNNMNQKDCQSSQTKVMYYAEQESKTKQKTGQAVQ